MGFLGKIFKPIKKVFKGIGKLIKKTFKGFGKFMNKLGIFGQIGMMFIMPGISNMAMRGLTRLGSGFMAGLGTAAQAGSGLAKVSHAILSTAANAARTGIGAVRTITDTVQGVVLDSAKGMLNKVPGLSKVVGPIPVIDPKTGLKKLTGGEVVAGNVGDIFKNAAIRLERGANKTWASLVDTGKSAGHIMPGGPEYSPEMKTYRVPEDEGLFGRGKGETVTRDINYNTRNRKAFQTSGDIDWDDYDATTKAPKVSTGPEVSATASQRDKTFFAQAGEDFRAPYEGGKIGESVATNVLTTEAMKAINQEQATAKDYSLGLPRGKTGEISLETQARGSGVPLAETGFDASTLHPDALDYNAVFNNAEYYDSMGYTSSVYDDMMQQRQRGQTPTFQGSYAYG